MDSPISLLKTQKQEIFFPKVDEFHIIGYSEFISNVVQEIKPLMKQRIQDKDQAQIQSEQNLQSLIKSLQLQELQEKEIKSSSQFSYQLIQDNSFQQFEYCYAISINKDCSIVAAGSDKQIKIFEFKQGMLKLNQIINEHKSYVSILNFMKQSKQFISGDWVIQRHSNPINCLILNKNEDLFISCSDDKTIRFWAKKNKQNNEWICQQIISDHIRWVYQIILNEQENQVISCGKDGLILVIEYSESNKIWVVIQKIVENCRGFRIGFINDNLFTFKPIDGNLMHVYEKNSVSKEFTRNKDIILTQGDDGYGLFPQQFIKQKQLIVCKHDKYINLIRKAQNGEFKVEQYIEFNTYYIYGQMSDDGEYLITWDNSSNEIQIRRYIEQRENYYIKYLQIYT
ncbi:unnamed protein product [Paramecium primaurelia]|uniref:WD40-repeat-containing domain n=1 Tax=Paramecium primaurelia TaxID=5886 RepID=A0A8S1PC85_PARPR|nr:unnamed protein product [Paramecium primaurelia]